MLPQAIVETLGYTQYEYTCRMVTLEVHSSLAAVGEKIDSSKTKLIDNHPLGCFFLLFSKKVFSHKGSLIVRFLWAQPGLEPALSLSSLLHLQ